MGFHGPMGRTVKANSSMIFFHGPMGRTVLSLKSDREIIFWQSFGRLLLGRFWRFGTPMHEGF